MTSVRVRRALWAAALVALPRAALAQDAVPTLEGAYSALQGRASDALRSARDAARTLRRAQSLISIQNDGHGDAALLRATLAAVQSSPSGKRLLTRLAVESVQVRLSFGDLGGTVFPDAGFVGSFAETDHASAVMGVAVNIRYVDWARQGGATRAALARQLAGPLAHELGHVVEGTIARRRGLEEAFGRYRGNEENAMLTGWLVAAELGEPVDGLARTYEPSPDAFFAALAERRLDYATTLPLSDLSSDPRSAYQRRRAALKASAAKDREELDNARYYSRIAAHFSTQHRPGDPLYRSERQLSRQRAAAQAGVDWYSEVVATLDRSDAALAKLDADVSGAYFAKLTQQASDPQFAAWERQIAEKRAAFAAELRSAPAPSSSSSSAWPADQVGNEELRRLYDEDRAAHPDHW